jgi:hypothetical protein
MRYRFLQKMGKSQRGKGFVEREGFSKCNDALVASFLGAQNVIHVEDIIAVLVVIAIVFGALAGLCQDSARVPRRLVLEARVADAICGRQMGRQSLERLVITN